MTTAQAASLVWGWAADVVGFLGFGAVMLLGFSLMKEITR